MKISVIVAAYNATKYLEETLESLLHQSFDDYEVIVVNDGSTDNTLDILQSYATQHPILKVCSKENGGPSSARNYGLDCAQGDYIFFFDADDILELDALEQLYNRITSENADLVIATNDMFDQYKRTVNHDIDSIITLDTIEKYEPKILMSYALWNKMFKREIIEKYHLRFPSINNAEDGAFLMQYVYHTRKITGLNMIICHYRRMFDGAAESITAFITPTKIRDFSQGHDIIWEAAADSFLRDYPQYSNLEDLLDAEAFARAYFNTILYKEIHLLLVHSYRKFWQNSYETSKLISDEVSKKITLLNAKSFYNLTTYHPDLCLTALPTTADEMLAKAQLSAVLYGYDAVQDDFINCLSALVVQRLNAMKIILPKGMEKCVKEQGFTQKNILYLEADSENELFYKALNQADTDYIVFCDPKIIYPQNAFLGQFKNILHSLADFYIELIYHRNYGTPQPTYLQCIVYNSLKTKISNNPFLNFDYTLCNKFFRVSFLRSVSLDYSHTLLENLPLLYEQGYFLFCNHGFAVYEDTLEAFYSFICKPGHEAFLQEYTKEKPIHSLNDPDCLPSPALSYQKLLKLPKPKNKKDKLFNSLVKKFSTAQIKNRTLFYTIRKDGKLEGTAKALYPYIHGKKVIFAHKNPHTFTQMLRAFWLFNTSKVIIVDDYARYLRHVAMKPEQRVIQLWHACGAFKQFGQYGTNMNVNIDLATHIQYNLVTVSGDAVRSIYADSFDIPIRRVKALGCARTDDFFNQDLLKAKRSAIYTKYPNFKNKKILLYAPTFRDIGQDRSQFHPKLDFKKLSHDLLPDQMLLIGPHPLMTNDIVEDPYDNIKVIRDFSTNDLMVISDLLITDYSSVIFEYALLKKPIIFYCYDLEQYNRGFYLNYPDDLPGDVFQTQEDLTDYLQHPDRHILNDKYNRFVEKYMSACDGHSCERIAQLINNYLEEEE